MRGKIFTTYEVSRFCSVDISTVMGWVDAGKLNAYRTPGGHRRISHGDLVAFLETYSMPVHPLLRKTTNRVLIVEDSAADARLLRRVIEKTDPSAEIVVASDGFEAGRQLETFSPDLILLDLMLPGVDGFQVCKNIRADELKKDVKILAVSALNTASTEKRILAQGADRFVQKPFNVFELQKVVAQLLDVSGDEHQIGKIERRASGST